MVGVLVVTSVHQTAVAQISFPRPSPEHSIKVNANSITHWVDGQYEVLHLQGDIQVRQNQLKVAADQAIIWVEIPRDAKVQLDEGNPIDSILQQSAAVHHKVIVYAEGQVTVDIDNQQNRIVDSNWFGRLFTSSIVDLERNSVPLNERDDPRKPEIFSRAKSAMAKPQDGNSGSISLASFEPAKSPQPPSRVPWVSETSPGTTQQLVINPQTAQIQSVAPADPFGGNSPSLPTIGQGSFNGNALPGNFSPITPIGPAPGQNALQQNPIPNAELPNAQLPNAGRGRANFTLLSRDGNNAIPIRSFINELNPNERVSILTGGIRLTIDSDEIVNLRAFAGDQDRQVIITADSVVNWILSLPDGTERNQFYMEGNIVFAKGNRVIYAERMFYDLETEQGTILKAEVLTTIQDYEGAVRMKADVVQQLDANNMQAYGAAFTSSRLGVPRYWLQSESILLQQVPGQSGDSLVFDPNNSVAAGINSFADESSGPPDDYLVDSRQNRVYVAGVPVFAWPRLQTSLNDPTLYLERIGINNDRIFGFQVTSGWNMYQLFGALRGRPLDAETIQGTQWIGVLDYLSDRGVGFGSEFEYDRKSLFGFPGRASGEYNSWFINDKGLDSLGRDRRDLVPEESFRGRSVLQHRHDFSPGYQLRAEIGYISDRNFLEQYYEREWDTQKDATTGIWLERNVGTDSYNLTADVQLNDFFTQTSGIKFDWFKLGQPILNNNAIWHSHTHGGYLNINQADAPTDPTDAAKFDPLAWETDAGGMRVGTRQEIDFPMQIGPVKVVPYVLGDATYWQEARDGNDLFRAYGQTGVRASLPMWRVDPSIQSVLWNVNGLAHKVTFDVDAFFADASQDLDELTLYDPLDDDAQEHFRRRFAFDTFNILPGGDVPLRFDERNFAFRSGMQGNVTAPSSEIADDLAAIKLGIRQRWQTKRGLPGREHIVDWIKFDAQATLFPNANRDNFGSDFGMFDYDFRWHVGDRVSLVSDGYFDFFSQGLRTASFGANISRPEIGNAYIGYRMIEGPISSNILSAAVTYRMSDKWGVKAGGQVDFGQTGTIGQTLSMIYIGESFLWQFGFNYDYSRENFGFRFGFEPRFNRRPRMFRPGGSAIPPASSRWLE